ERFSQCGYSGVTQRDYSNGMLAYANLWPDRDSGKLARLIARTAGQRASPWIRAYFNDTEPAAIFSFNTLPLDYFAKASRSLFMRNQWSANASSINFSLGRSPAQGHKHFDGGSFQWWRNGRWVSRESTGYQGAGESVRGLDGVGTVDVLQAVAHNTVLFEGKATINGERGLPEGNAEMLRLYSTNEFVYGAADLTPSFRYRRPPNPCRYDWPYAERAVREFVFLRSIETLVLIDRLTGSGDSGRYLDNLVDCFNPFTGVRRTPAEVRRHVVIHGMEAFTQSGNWYVSNSGTERIAVHPLLPASGRTINAINERTGTGGAAQGNFRLDIGSFGADTIEFVNVVHAGGASATLPSVSLVNDGANRIVRIVKDAVQYDVRFQLGALPQTTSVAIGSNSITPPTTIDPLQPAEFAGALFDIDGNRDVDAATDGVLITRYALGLRGDALIANVVGGGATRTSVDDITNYLNSIASQLDIDSDGQLRAATDAMLVSRYLRATRGSALTTRAMNGNAQTLDQIEQKLRIATDH
ncbi:MAG: hypothetical protein ACRDAM_05840, partial [Casimicrobium sp.]